MCPDFSTLLPSATEAYSLSHKSLIGLHYLIILKKMGYANTTNNNHKKAWLIVPNNEVSKKTVGDYES